MKNVLITGSSGFLGKNLLNTINKQSLQKQFNFLTPNSKELNLLDSNSVILYFNAVKVDYIIHMSALAGGIGLNQRRPADLTHLNNKMTVNIFDAIRNYNIEYFIGIGSVCSYPKFCQTPFSESDMWSGKSEETNRGYGESKKMLITELQSHMEQYGLKGAILVPTNLFGKYDHFNKNELEDNHVIPALIIKFVNAKENNLPNVYCWGTGRKSVV